MQEVGNIPWEMVVIILTFIALAIVPPMVGFWVLKAYRHYRPVQETKQSSSPLAQTKTKDGFMKMLLVGWVICGPIVYGVFVFVRGLLER